MDPPAAAPYRDIASHDLTISRLSAAQPVDGSGLILSRASDPTMEASTEVAMFQALTPDTSWPRDLSLLFVTGPRAPPANVGSWSKAKDRSWRYEAVLPIVATTSSARVAAVQA